MTPVGPRAAQAQTADEVRQQVRQLVREAAQLMERGERAQAVGKLLEAQRLRPDPSIDYNLGMAYAEMGNPVQSAQSLDRFVRTADRGAVLADRIEDAKRRLGEFQRTLARLNLQVTTPADHKSVATVYVDEEPRGPLAFAPSDGATAAPLWLAPGAHKIRVAAAGARDYAVSVELRAGEQRTLSGELLAESSGPALVPSSDELRAQSEPTPLYKKWWFWTAIGGGTATVVGLIAAGAAGRFSHVAAGSDLEPVDVGR